MAYYYMLQRMSSNISVIKSFPGVYRMFIIKEKRVHFWKRRAEKGGILPLRIRAHPSGGL